MAPLLKVEQRQLGSDHPFVLNTWVSLQSAQSSWELSKRRRNGTGKSVTGFQWLWQG